MRKFDDFDLDLTNVKSEVRPMKWTDNPTDITCPEDTCNCRTYDYKCDDRPTRIYTMCVCEV